MTTLTATEYRLLVEHSPVMVWRAGLDAKCDYFNETWLAFTGRTLAEEAGDGWAEGVHPEDLERCVAHYLEHFHRREAFEMEYRLRRHDGEWRWIFDRGVPYADDDGVFAGFIGSCVDVDERRRAQDERKRRDQEELEYARDFERWLLAIVSHDIRNPLGAISLAAQLLARGQSDQEKLRQTSERISRSVARIQSLVNDLLDVSRERHGGGLSLSVTSANLRAVCQQVVDELVSSQSGQQIALECDAEVSGIWDPNRLAQALSNLVGNAVQHGTPGSPVRVMVREDGDRALIEVHNDGHIPEDLVPVIFDPFRSGARERPSGGLGLGLFIAQAIARAHRGGIEVQSTPAHGTTFRMMLPRTAA
jgi:PAS domain S-box-containing protein